jgi:lipopolysaccharide heptosyltransferase II
MSGSDLKNPLQDRIPPRRSERILLVSVNWLGDLLFMTPAIRAIRKKYPKAHLVCLSPPRGREVLQANPHLNELIFFEESRGLRGLLELPKLIRQLRAGRFNTVFLFHRSMTRALAAALAGIPNRIGYKTWKRNWLLTQSVESPPKDRLHKSEIFLKLLEGVGIPSDGISYDLSLTDSDQSAVSQLLNEWGIQSQDRMIALHVGANWHLKRWPVKQFSELADRLNGQFGAKVIFIGSEADKPLVESVTQKMQTTPFSAVGRTSFGQLGALLKRANLFISNDSGPLHLGLAVGTPVIGIFGPTDPDLSGPLQGRRIDKQLGLPVVQKELPQGGSDRSTVLFGSIGCPVPCYQLDCPENLCMDQISVDDVLREAEVLLKKRSSVHKVTGS